jgi:hypothetical protein
MAAPAKPIPATCRNPRRKFSGGAILASVACYKSNRAVAGEFPDRKGDNCLLTLDFAFIDLPFSPLLA